MMWTGWPVDVNDDMSGDGFVNCNHKQTRLVAQKTYATFWLLTFYNDA